MPLKSLKLDEPLAGIKSQAFKIAMTNRHANVVFVAMERGMLQGETRAKIKVPCRIFVAL